MSKPKILLADAFGIGVRCNIAEGEENFSRETRTGLDRMRLIFDQAGRVEFAQGMISPDQFLSALNERLRTPITMWELVCLWTSTYEVQHDLEAEFGASGMPPFVWCSHGSAFDFDWLRARRLHKWNGCRGIFMSGPGRIKSRPAYYDLLRLHLSTKVLCEELDFSDMVMIDTSIENVGCARSLGIDARVLSPFGVRGMLQDLRQRA
ncbi:MAG: hypothetical protein U0103_16570 [Candidatus Obscuribacterales bacterium]